MFLGDQHRDWAAVANLEMVHHRDPVLHADNPADRHQFLTAAAECDDLAAAGLRSFTAHHMSEVVLGTVVVDIGFP
ncbi:hypothetical protein ACIBQ2_06370 [Micromonospora sediminimaris]|uniref:hypothetical protein n=1 Tax=Micromonospora sediminimaris TaxID=547162 RepID=UPI00378BD2FC